MHESRGQGEKAVKFSTNVAHVLELLTMFHLTKKKKFFRLHSTCLFQKRPSHCLDECSASWPAARSDIFRISVMSKVHLQRRSPRLFLLDIMLSTINLCNPLCLLMWPNYLSFLILAVFTSHFSATPNPVRISLSDLLSLHYILSAWQKYEV